MFKLNIHDDRFEEGVVTDHSISIDLPQIKHGKKTEINYNGILSTSGAEKLYLHYGFDGWNNAETVPMRKTHHGNYSAHIKVDGRNELNFCFKDNANNWDNNSGANWKVGINS